MRRVELFIADIFAALFKIERYIEPFDSAEGFRHSGLHWDAVMRQLEIVGELLNRLLKNEAFRHQAPSYFRSVVNFRNVIVHAYFGIDEDEVWDIVTQKLHLLRQDLSDLAKTYDMREAIEQICTEEDEAICMHLKEIL